MKLLATLIILAVLSAVCMSVPQLPVSPAIPPAAANPAIPSAGKQVQKPGNINTQATPEDAEESPESECGPVHGKCPNNLCCSLHNECGQSTAHCNVSLGCKRKWGVCH